MKICYVKLIRMKLGILCVEADGEELRLFSSREKAEEWLLLNDFRYGQRNFFDYPVKMNMTTIRNLGMISTIHVGLSYLQAAAFPRQENSLEDFYIIEILLSNFL